VSEVAPSYVASAVAVVRVGESSAGGSEKVRARACPLSEAELALIWAGQRFPPEALSTPDGRGVRVLHPGRRNAGAGPDFRDAIVLIAGEERRGDVELHLRASAFRGHGHDRDPAYDGLALHAVYLADEGPETRLSSGGSAPVAAFAPWLARRRAEVERWLTAPALWREPCRDAQQRLGPAAVEAALAAAGEGRFAGRAARLAQDVAGVGAEAALWQALFDALGVGGDRAAFRHLAELCTPALARSVAAAGGRNDGLEAALLALAGLRPASAPLAALLPAGLSPPLARTGRPANRPERRLAAFARLYARAEGDLAGFAVASVVGAESARELVAAWQVGGPDKVGALLGRERARELVVNVVLPFVATRAELRPKAASLLAEMPAAPPYGKTRFLEANLRRADGWRAAGSALAQQGLLAYLGEWCSRGGCGRCPLS